MTSLLREEHEFRGYIHLKTIPDADPLLIAEAGRYADRLSVNIELPTETSLIRLAPEEKLVGLERVQEPSEDDIEPEEGVVAEGDAALSEADEQQPVDDQE